MLLSLGKCFSDDKWPECTGGCNDFETGNSCFQDNSAKCSAGNGVAVEIQCNTGIQIGFFQATGWQNIYCNLTNYFQSAIVIQ